MRTKILLIFALCCLLPVSIAAAHSETCETSMQDALTSGQALLDAGDYAGARAAFYCAIEANPTEIDAYRGHMEAALLNGDFTFAIDDFTRFRTRVLVEDPDAFETVIAGYESALDADPNDLRALTGYSFMLWLINDREGAAAAADRILEQDPENVYALLFRGSSKFYLGDAEGGSADVGRAIELAPDNAASLFVIADAYTYALQDYESALEIGISASDMGLDSPRLLALIAADYLALGDEAGAAQYFASHIKASTTEYVDGDPLAAGGSVVLEMASGRSYHIPLEVEAGEHLTIMTEGDPVEMDSYIALIAPDGQPVTGNDDFADLNAGFETDILAAGTYYLMVSTFDAAGAGELTVTRS